MPRNPRTEPPGCHQMGRLCLGEREVCTCETAEPLKTAEITASGLVLHVQRFATCPRSKPKHLDDSIFRHFLEYLRFRLTAYLEKKTEKSPCIITLTEGKVNSR